jgi:hypothetical protein
MLVERQRLKAICECDNPFFNSALDNLKEQLMDIRKKMGVLLCFSRLSA